MRLAGDRPVPSHLREKYSLVGRDASTKPALLVRALQDGILTISEL